MKIITKFSVVSLLILGLVPSTSASIDKNLKYGQRDKEVTELQEFLIDAGFLKTTPSNYFGLLTLKAVKTYQKTVDVSPTGYVGLLTRQKINDSIASDVASSNQAEIQETGTIAVQNTNKEKISVTTNQVVDICKNIEGIQTAIPTGMVLDSTGKCFTSTQSSNTETKVCMSGKIVSKNDDCTKVCSDGEIVLENLTCRTTAPTNTNISQQTNYQTQTTGQNNSQTQQNQTTSNTPPKLISTVIGGVGPGIWDNGNGHSNCNNCIYLQFDKPVYVTFSYFDATNLLQPTIAGSEKGKIWQEFGDSQSKQTVTSSVLSSRHVFKFYSSGDDSQVQDYPSDQSSKSQITEINLNKARKYYWSISAKDTNGNSYVLQSNTETAFPSSWNDNHYVGIYETASLVRTPGFVEKTIPSNTTNVKIGSFTLQGGFPGYLASQSPTYIIQNVSVKLTYNGLLTNVSNLTLKNGSDVIGTPLANVSNNATFSPANNETSRVQSNSLKVFDIYADIGNVTGTAQTDMTVNLLESQHLYNVSANGVTITAVTGTP
ncbi:MAG: peptidoglycan-binding domain-containing protein [Candidatus Nomurabacteria bacterium]